MASRRSGGAALKLGSYTEADRGAELVQDAMRWNRALIIVIASDAKQSSRDGCTERKEESGLLRFARNDDLMVQFRIITL